MQNGCFLHNVSTALRVVFDLTKSRICELIFRESGPQWVRAEINININVNIAFGGRAPPGLTGELKRSLRPRGELARHETGIFPGGGSLLNEVYGAQGRTREFIS